MSEIKLIDIGSAPVDSGQLFITDPCYIDNYKQGDGNLHIQVETKEYLDDPTIKEKNFYTRVSEKSLEDNHGNVCSGVVFSSGGDGNFSVYLVKDGGSEAGVYISLDGSKPVLELDYSHIYGYAEEEVY